VDVRALVDVGWSVVPGALNGDYNGNGTVDAADYVVWRKSIGTPQPFNLWRANFGATGPGSGVATGSPFALAVPEPTSWVLIVVAVGLLMAPRRRQ
jgi:hypothetical protein